MYQFPSNAQPDSPDVRLRDRGPVWIFTLTSKDARDWASDNVCSTFARWSGRDTFTIDPCDGRSIVNLMIYFGLTVEYDS